MRQALLSLSIIVIASLIFISTISTNVYAIVLDKTKFNVSFITFDIPKEFDDKWASIDSVDTEFKEDGTIKTILTFHFTIDDTTSSDDFLNSYLNKVYSGAYAPSGFGEPLKGTPNFVLFLDTNYILKTYNVYENNIQVESQLYSPAIGKVNFVCVHRDSACNTFDGTKKAFFDQEADILIWKLDFQKSYKVEFVINTRNEFSETDYEKKLYANFNILIPFGHLKINPNVDANFPEFISVEKGNFNLLSYNTELNAIFSEKPKIDKAYSFVGKNILHLNRDSEILISDYYLMDFNFLYNVNPKPPDVNFIIFLGSIMVLIILISGAIYYLHHKRKIAYKVIILHLINSFLRKRLEDIGISLDKCEHCNKSFDNPTDLDKHKKSEHKPS